MPDPIQDPVSPVRPIPTDDGSPPLSGIALCLSGGGYRAMLFHVGALWRLSELGYLPTLDRVSSVSGGSITAGRARAPLAPALVRRRGRGELRRRGRRTRAPARGPHRRRLG